VLGYILYWIGSYEEVRSRTDRLWRGGEKEKREKRKEKWRVIEGELVEA